MISFGDDWRLVFSPHEENIGVVVVTRCTGAEPFYAYNWRDITPQHSSQLVRKVDTPPGATCHYLAHVMRHNPSDDSLATTETTYVGETATP